jgi:acyl carrier protein
METKEQILAILKEVKPTKNLENVTDIIEGGYIDSFELMSLVMRLNETFGIEITIDELVPENFNSVVAISEMVDRLIVNK